MEVRMITLTIVLFAILFLLLSIIPLLATDDMRDRWGWRAGCRQPRESPELLLPGLYSTKGALCLLFSAGFNGS
jgi:hypothetical protein